MDFYSHDEPKVILRDHLQNVALKSEKIILSKKLNVVNKQTLAQVSYLIGISHDFGKYTSYFQKNRINKIPICNESLGNHGLISAFFTLELLMEFIKSKNLEKDEIVGHLPQLGYFVVKHHHGNLENIEHDVDSEQLLKSNFRLIKTQIDDMNENLEMITKEYSYLLRNYDIEIQNVFSKLEKYRKKITYDEDIKAIIKRPLKVPISHLIRKDSIIFYMITQLLFSTLIDSDKKSAGRVKEIPRKELSADLVEKYISQKEFGMKNDSNLNHIRNQIRESVLTNINTKNKIFTITAPTGTGKTLSSLSGALKLRKMLKQEMKLVCEPRIIYSLPFTSIIDQSFDVFDHVLSQISDFHTHKSEYLLKHHYLSDVFYKTSPKDENTETEVDESLALIESWESEIVITTFIQLFHSLIGYKNRMLKKFHNIVNSILILDEVQNIPLKYWSLVHDVLLALTDYFNCRVILMTATKPLIFNEKNDTFKELVSDYKHFFQSDELNRVKLRYCKSQTIDEFNNILTDLNLNSYLFVLNTIGSSLEFFNKIKYMPKYKKIYLSTNIIPKERKKRIEDIKELIDKNRNEDNKKKFIIVSTQMIEAGVDIDCECVYRDLGPLDSIIQVSGRCNRNNVLKNKGKMNVFRLKKNENYDFCRIYDPTLIDISEMILNKKKIIRESDFLELIEEYFSEAEKRMYSESNLNKSIKTLNYNDKEENNPISSFKLIDEDYYRKDVFVEINKAAINVWNKFESLQEINESYMRKLEFLKFRKEFYEYVISIPKKCLPPDHNSGIYYLRNNRVKEYYDEETGYKIDKVLPPMKSVTIF